MTESSKNIAYTAVAEDLVDNMSSDHVRNTMKTIIKNYNKALRNMGAIHQSHIDKEIDEMHDSSIRFFLSNHIRNPQSLKIRMTIDSGVAAPGQMRYYV